MPEQRKWYQSTWRGWAAAPLSILLAVALQYVTLQLGAGKDFPFAFYYMVAVFTVAWKAGALPGVLGCLTIMVGIPMSSPSFHLNQIDPWRLAGFCGVSLLVSAVAAAQRRIQNRLQESNEELDRRVAARTGELAESVAQLESEVEERRKTEAALLESKQRVDLTLNAAGIGRWDLDVATGQISRSSQCDHIFGYDTGHEASPATSNAASNETSSTDWTIDGVLEHIHPEDRPRLEATVLTALQGGDIVDADMRIRRADGETRWVWARGKAFRDAEGRVTRMLGSLRDVTESKQAAQRLQVQLERLSLLDQITRGIGERHDLRSIFQVAIRSIEENLPVDFGCVCLYHPEDETLEVTCVGVRSEEFAMELAMKELSRFPVGTNGLSRCVQGTLVYEPDVSELDHAFPRRVANAGLRSLVAAPLVVAKEVFGVLLAARTGTHAFASPDCEFLRQLSEHVALAAHQANIRTALKQAYEDLQRTQQSVMQQERLRALGQMASGIAHDINNAISPVTLYTETLLETEPQLSTRARGFLETIHRAIDDVAETVARMRQFYRPQESQMVLMPVDLGTLAQQVLDLTAPHWRSLAQKKGISIRPKLELTRGLPAILGIESEIREALTNLVINAADAMPSGGELILRTRLGGEPGAPRMHLEVTDTGIGMDEDTLRRCLEPFFTTKGERGTGLGLAMVYGVMQRHQGRVEFDSAPGRGTTARLNFPVPDARPEVKTVYAEPPKPAQMRILVVDDDPLLIRSLRDTLEIDGHDIVTADGGEKGIATFQQDTAFAAVITDLGMPHVDGTKVALAIKAASPGTPVILLTGWGQRLNEEGEMPPHVDCVLSKPPKLRDLRAALAKHVTGEPARAA